MGTNAVTGHEPGPRGRGARAYNQFLERAVLPLGDVALRTEFMRELRRWRRIERLSAPELARLQRTGLGKVLHHATTRVPHYRDLQVRPAEDPYEWLRRFPILTKQDLRTEGERLVTPGSKGLVKITSSGSSGIQSTLWASPREMSRSQGIQALWWEWAGYRLGDRLLQTGMTPERGMTKVLKDRLLRTTYVVAFGLTDDEMAEILARGVDRPWRHIGGYASSLDAFARVAAREPRIPVHFESAISWGDKLYPQHRAHLADAFDAPVIDTYGATEGFMIAAQRWEGPYYVMSPHVVVELLDEHDDPVPPGELGRVVVTRLDARAMPMIRFRLGDLAVAPAEPVLLPGAPAFPQLERIIGRETDVWVSPGGRTLTVHTFTGVLEHVEQIEQFSVVPRSAGLTMEYIAAGELESDELDQVTRALRGAVGEEISITWRRVTHIPDSPSGKPQIIRPPAS